jgi:hypothetical protein
MKVETSKITFRDGRRGEQTVYVHEDGTRELTEIVVTAQADGRPCLCVYNRRPDLQSEVFGLTDLGNARWSIVPGSVGWKD